MSANDNRPLTLFCTFEHQIENYKQCTYNTKPFVCHQPPALRVFLLGVRGSGKTTHGKWLAEQLGVFHIQFRERLQEIILRKTQKHVSYADDTEPPEEPPEELQGLLEAQAQSTVSPPDQDDKPGHEDTVSDNPDTKVKECCLYFCLEALLATE